MIGQSPHRHRRQRAQKRGGLAETLAALLLRVKGYQVLARGVETPVGELDLIARKGDTLVFVEVKYRRSTEAATAAIAPWQRRRIERAALYFMQGKASDAAGVRFDAIVLAPWRLPRHIPNAWMNS